MSHQHYVTYKGERYLQAAQPTPLHQCDDCGKRFYSRGQLNRHVKSVHGPRLYCHMCNFSTPGARAYRLREHMRDHQERPSPRGNPRGRRPREVARDQVTFDPPRRTDITPPQTSMLDRCPPSPLLSEWGTSPLVVLGEEVDLLGLGDMELPEVKILASTPVVETATSGTIVAQQSTQGGAEMVEDVVVPEDILIPGTAVTAEEPMPTETAQVPQASHDHSMLDSKQTVLNFEYLAEDPRFFFLGAPSSILEGNTAQLLKKNKNRARSQGQQFKRYFVPEGFLSVRRVERATLPDGTTYQLTDFWTKDPECKKTSDKATQT
ncbi:uncharacterized protein [Argopecten irradians]|uniref:uncharacterized protein n=1 Tax=Argopecten irradians TaxID=31199 RepID=UPI0037179190